ncbi:xenotropic and polytropic retrovirus receptor 1 homolog [Drosophila kikkawai]|uniref:Xenotropic and polytropic retrovirus receptor 1 homolog n=1 Tax=Drosophila kikkawai TaxID=30033 RepID=A0A6P4JG47_DROKI|nr:xenotropic and polytropic retrovirus receptor 1 homolog [Drosophila kikkawai]
MKFGKTFESLLTSEWQKQYMNYNELKAIIMRAVDDAPEEGGLNISAIREYYQEFEAFFLNTCHQELTRVNDFFNYKQAEARRKLATLNYQLMRTGTAAGSANSRNQQQETNPKPPTANKLRLAMREFYLSLIMMQNYQTLNNTGFRKICKKYDKYLKSDAALAWYERFVLGASFTVSSELDRMIVTVEDLYTQYLAKGDRFKAMESLRVPPLGQPTPLIHLFFSGLSMGLFLVGFIMCLLVYFCLDLTPEFRSIFISLFRGPISGVIFGLYLAINVNIWQKVGINHVLIFELERRDAVCGVKALEMACFLGYFCSLNVLLYLLYNEFYMDNPYMIPLVEVAVVAVIVLNPIHILFYSARIWLLRVTGRMLLAPFFFVQFADFWLADQWCSVVTCFVDHYRLVRFYVRYLLGWPSAFDFGADYAVAIIRCLPPWIRLWQSLRRYRDSSSRSADYLINAFKYTLSIIVVIFSTVQMETSGNYKSVFQNPWTWVYLTSALISSFYSLAWDMLKDFGLFREWKGENLFLRDQLVYPKWFYYFVIVENTLLRFVWLLEFAMVYQNVLASHTGTTLASFCEMTRRFLWNFLRLENEHLNNCGQFRATRDIFITRVNSEEELLLESMMDESEKAGKEHLDKKYF